MQFDWYWRKALAKLKRAICKSGVWSRSGGIPVWLIQHLYSVLEFHVALFPKSMQFEWN